MNLITIFIILQIILLTIITLHDWIHLPPLTDINALKNSIRLSNDLSLPLYML